jgi:dihydroflavonol-4-reductase
LTVGSASNSSDNSKNSIPPRRVLVTGASGFIGSHLVPKLVAGGFVVSTFGRTSGKPHFESLGVNHICGDVTNYEQVLAASAGHDIIFHMAGLVSYRSVDLTRQRAVNVEGTRNVMEAALASGVGRVIHTSSIAAFGIHKPEKIIDEKTVYN